ncbi:MAG: complex I NDUFA9 subunit family protein [Arenicellales bacterium]
MLERLVTVFGGTGFLGRHVVKRALKEGWSVRIATRHPRPEPFADPAAERVSADIRDPEAVAAAVRGATGVVNAVALYAQSRSQKFDATHVIGAGHLARAARRVSARLVHLSGIGVDRRSPSPYVRARAVGEERVRDACPQSVILRPSALFGPGDALVSTLELMLKWSPVIPLFGNGDSRIQPVYVEDVARAVVAALLREGVEGNTFELGGPDVFTYRQLYEAVAARLGRRRWFVPVSFRTWRMIAAASSLLPGTLITRDQIELVRHDNVAGADKSFADLGIEASSLTHLLDTVKAA